jgi:hypothetical protein
LYCACQYKDIFSWLENRSTNKVNPQIHMWTWSYCNLGLCKLQRSNQLFWDNNKAIVYISPNGLCYSNVGYINGFLTQSIPHNLLNDYIIMCLLALVNQSIKNLYTTFISFTFSWNTKKTLDLPMSNNSLIIRRLTPWRLTPWASCKLHKLFKFQHE